MKLKLTAYMVVCWMSPAIGAMKSSVEISFLPEDVLGQQLDLIGQTKSQTATSRKNSFTADQFSSSKVLPKNSKALSLGQTEQALTLPSSHRIHALLLQGVHGYQNLQSIAFDSKASLESRWRALMAMGEIGRKHALPDLERGLASKLWFMRLAALKALSHIDSAKASFSARYFVEKDPSLLVRSGSVEVIRRLQDRKSLPLLWKILYSKKNYLRGESLSIRRRVIDTIANLSSPSDSARFIKALRRDGETLHKDFIVALERVNRLRLGEEEESLEGKISHWNSWWREKLTKIETKSGNEISIE